MNIFGKLAGIVATATVTGVVADQAIRWWSHNSIEVGSKSYRLRNFLKANKNQIMITTVTSAGLTYLVFYYNQATKLTLEKMEELAAATGRVLIEAKGFEKIWDTGDPNILMVDEVGEFLVTKFTR